MTQDGSSTWGSTMRGVFVPTGGRSRHTFVQNPPLLSLLALKVVRVSLLQFVEFRPCHPDVVIHHQCAQLAPIDQDDVRRYHVYVCKGIARIGRSRDEDPLARPRPL